MSRRSFALKKRAPIMVIILFLGVICAGVMSARLETPQGTYAFLHGHLKSPPVDPAISWRSADFDLPQQDKIKLSNLIAKIEEPLSAKAQKEMLTGQALAAVQANACGADKSVCNIPLRLNRKFSTVHLNKDFRVVNVQENALRATLAVKQETTDIKLTELADETRVLSFYQTQGGWIHNVSATIETAPLSVKSREAQFRNRFSEQLIGINYYPASASWEDFWDSFPRVEIESDLRAAKSLNVNALRIFLNHAYFNAPETQAEALMKLETFLDMCEAQGLAVLLTLFDLRPDYTLSNWGADIGHIDTVLTRVSAHPAVLGVDLKNQADLDFDTWGQGRVEGWLTVMARHIQTHYSQLPVTTGWSHPDNATRLHDIFDFVTYHEYENPKGFEARLHAVIKHAGDKPVMITELGSTTWHPPFIKSLNEGKQAARLETQLKQANQATGVFVWTLNDFTHVSREIVGPLPWRRAQQKHFGLIREDGTHRPAATILKSFGEQASKSVDAKRPSETPH